MVLMRLAEIRLKRKAGHPESDIGSILGRLGAEPSKFAAEKKVTAHSCIEVFATA
jgi:hypothetical protein